MKITCNREQLLTAFQTVASVAPSRSPKPILQNVKIEVDAESTTLMATDLEQGIRLGVAGVEVDVPGEAVLPVDQFGSILRETTDEKLRIAADHQGTSVEGERSEFRLSAQDPSQFPVIRRFEESAYYELPARLFREMIRRTLFAIDVESSRYALGGVLLEPDGETLSAVGTDGRRLAKMEGPVATVGEPEGVDGSIIIPARAMVLMDRALSDADAEVQLSFRSSEVLLRSERATIYGRLLEGRFPAVAQEVFPVRDDAVTIGMTVGPLYSAVRQAAIVTNKESRGIDFAFGDGTLVLAGQTAEIGQARIELPIAYDGPDVSIMLDPRFLIDFLKVLDPEKTIQWEMKDADSAAVARTDDGYGYVIMPLSRDRVGT